MTDRHYNSTDSSYHAVLDPGGHGWYHRRILPRHSGLDSRGHGPEEGLQFVRVRPLQNPFP